MNRQFLFALFLITAFASCKAQKQNLVDTAAVSNQNKVIKETDAVGAAGLSDSVLEKLQTESDLIVIHAIENFAWSRSINYSIIAKQNNTWKGFTYRVNLMNRPGQQNNPAGLKTVTVNDNKCDSLLSFLTQNEAWKIKGSFGRNECDSSKSCVINDAASSRLWIITKTHFINPSYYAPEFYEQCCPNKERGLFVSITTQIEDALNKEESFLK